MLTYAEERAAGHETISRRSSGQAGGDWVRASTMVTPSAHMSPAADILPSFASGESYKDDSALAAEESPAGRTLSLDIFTRSSTTRTFGGFNCPCTKFLP